MPYLKDQNHNTITRIITVIVDLIRDVHANELYKTKNTCINVNIIWPINNDIQQEKLRG